MLGNREQAFEWVKKDSGGFNRDDPEGLVKYGIRQGILGLWLGREATEQDVRDLDWLEAAAIYRAWYWDRLRCDKLPAGIDYFSFDCGITCGLDVTTRWLQSVVELKEERGITPSVIAALRVRNPRCVIEGMEFLRRRRHKSSPDWFAFGEVWTNRVNRVKKRALALAENADAA